jgi:hypothetical protein
MLIELLIVATLLVDLIACSGEPSLGHRLVNEALAFSQISLVTIWSAFGRKTLPWRLMLVVVVIGAWALAISHPLGSADRIQNAWMMALLMQAGLIFGVLLFARGLGVGLSDGTVPGGDKGPGLRPRLPQFSIGYLLAWITATAVVLSLLKSGLDRRVLFPGPFPNYWREAAAFSLANGALALAVLWTLLAGRWRPSLLLLYLLAAVGIVACELVQKRGANEPSTALTMASLQLLWLTGSLWVVRMAGYRIARHDPTVT